MPFNHYGGAHGASSHYAHDTYHSNHLWRYFVALIAGVSLFGIGAAVNKAYASIQEVSLTLPTQSFAVAPLAQPVTSQPMKNDALLPALQTWQAQQKSQWAFYVQSLDSDELSVAINADTQFELASIYKLFLLEPLEKKIPSAAWADSKVVSRTYEECVIAMLAASDNPCAETIAGKLGWASIHQQTQASGYRRTVFDRNDYIAGTAADTGLLLERLERGEGFDAKTKSLALSALAKPKHVEAIRRSCDSCDVFNKTGDFHTIKHDAAIVKKNGKRYIVVIFSQDSTWPKMTEVAAIISDQL